MKKVTVLAPAKLNLALDITGLAPNSYHLVDMVMQAISLYEKVEIAKSGGYSLRCPGSPIPTDEKNTATRAAKEFFTETGLLAGTDIIIHKRVPTRAGMAGGSADAAAVLFGLNELYSARLTMGQLCEIGLRVGADVPFALLGGTARVTGIGEVMQPLAPLPPCWFAIGMPRGGVSTPEAYALYDKLGSPVHPEINALQGAIEAGALTGICRHMQNALEHANGGRRTADIRQRLTACGALASMMTGSGAAVFGLFETEKQARQAAGQIQPLVHQTFVVQPVAHGPRLVGIS